MLRSSVLKCIKKPSSTLDYTINMPKDYVERMKRTVPKKIYSNRLGAPDIIRWELPPEDYVPEVTQPWSQDTLIKNFHRAHDYHSSLLQTKFFKLRKSLYNKKLADENWFIFRGDFVIVMVGKDKYKKGKVIQVSRGTNTVLVEGLHTKLGKEMDGNEHLGISSFQRWQEQPLDVSKNEVKLVNPFNGSPTEVVWKTNNDNTEYVRVCTSTNRIIPIPEEAFVTYEYVSKKAYLESDKDTTADNVLKRSYEPKLCTFEDEILKGLGIIDERQRKPTFWY